MVTVNGVAGRDVTTGQAGLRAADSLTLTNGRAIRVFTLVDACTRECVAQHAAAGFKRSDVAEFPTTAGRQRGTLPEIVPCDNGTVFSSTAVDHWA